MLNSSLLLIAHVAVHGSKAAVGLAPSSGFFTVLALLWEGSQSKPRAAIKATRRS